MPLRHEIEAALARYQANVPDTSAARVSALAAIEALESRHWKLFCETRARVLGVPPDYGLHDARVEAFRRAHLDREPAWQGTR